MPPRTSTRIVANAATSYARLITTFVLGLFMVWYLMGAVGLEIFGLIAIAMGTFGLSHSIEGAIEGSLNREFSAAIATKKRDEVSRVFTNAIALTARFAVVALLFSLCFSGLALLGVFNVPTGHPYMKESLALLFAVEGVLSAVRLTLAPYRQALYGDRRIGLDNLLMLVSRVANAVATVLVFSVIVPNAAVHTQLMIYAFAHAAASCIHVAIGVILARRLVSGMTFRRSMLNTDLRRSIGRSALHTGQHLVLIDYASSFIGIIINLFFGPAFNGMWQIAITIYGHGRLLAESALRGIDPIITHLRHAKRDGLIQELMIRAIRYQLAVALPWVVMYIIFMEPILRVWIGGRLARDPNLDAVGISIDEAIRIISLMGTLTLVAMVLRVATRGVERSLYGLGHIASYAWAAKYACVLNIALTIALFAIFQQPWMAAIPLVIINFLYYDVIVLRAARREADFPVLRAMKESMPRPLLAGAILAATLLAVRANFATHHLIAILLVLVGTAAIAAILFLTVVIVPDERARLLQLAHQTRQRLLPRRN